jgi:recombination protein RecA
MGLAELKEAINKKYGKDIIFSPAKDLGIVKMPRFSSGSLALDIDLGGGWPERKVIEIFGPESSGKSLLLYHAIATVTNRDKNNKAVLIDEEGSYDIAWGKKCGIKEGNLEIVRSEYAEQALDILELCVQSGEFGLVGLDSIAALIPKEELDGSTEDWQMGLTARLMNKCCRKCYRALNASSRSGGSTTVFLINQLRFKIGQVFGNPETTTGGQGVKYASSIRLDIRKDSMVTQDEVLIGQDTRYTVVKNKTAPPLKKGHFRYGVAHEFAGKINNYRALAEVGELLGFLSKAGSWYGGEWLPSKLQGFDKVVNYFDELDKKTLGKMLKGVEAAYSDMQLEFKW